MNNHYSVSMVRHFQKVVAKMDEAAEHYKHRPRATKWSADRYYNFKNKSKGVRKKMKQCVYFKKVKGPYALRCLRDGSLRKSCQCPHFKPTFLYKLFNGGWKSEKRTYKH